MNRLFALAALLSLTAPLYSQTNAEKVAVQVVAKATELPTAQITLTWKDDLAATKWNVYRKNDTGHFELVKTVLSPDTTYIDQNVKTGKSYTYLIHKEDVSKVLGFAQVTAGIRTRANPHSGRCLLLVEDSVASALHGKVLRFKDDLIREGWRVRLQTVSTSHSHFAIKDTIKKEYKKDSGLSQVVLIGNIAVPYSGYIAPDGHTAATTPNTDHEGAWACDAYYGDIDGLWTDKIVTATNSPERRLNFNEPGDGKFDQSFLPSDLEVAIGRIYLEKFNDYETDRMKLYERYFDRNHAYRTRQWIPREKSLINDYFKVLSEGFAGIGYRSFPSISGHKNVSTGRLAELAIDSSYLFAYGCGGGEYHRAGPMFRDQHGNKIDSFAVGETEEYFKYEINCAFNILFGSFFGDWDSRNNLLRAPLAGKSPALASFWAGRPVWHLNEFLHGGTIGESTLNSQNSDLDLFTFIDNSNTYERMVHVALMGDPTIRLRYVDPIDSLKATHLKDSSLVLLTWAHDKANVGYYVYSVDSATGKLNLLTQSGASTASFVDSFPNEGTNHYLVRAIKIHDGHSGSYEILSPGVKTTIRDVKVLPIGDRETLAENFRIEVFPNPADRHIFISCSAGRKGSFQMVSLDGRTVLDGHLNGHSQKNKIDIANLDPGLYVVKSSFGNQSKSQRLLILE